MRYWISSMIFLFLFISLTPVFGQLTNDSIVVTTDKTSYSEGETIVITGEVRDLYSGTPISLIMKDPNGNLVEVSQISINSDKTFDTLYGDTHNNYLMKDAGDYTITVQYGTVNRSDTTTFYFEGNASTPYPPHKSIKFTVDTNRNYYTSGDTIKITGSISSLAEYSQTVTIVIVSPDGNVVSILQVMPNADGTFSTTVKAGSAMTVSGDYEIRAQYGSQKTTNTFVFTTGESNSKCDIGTIFHPTSNSCVLKGYQGNVNKSNQSLEKPLQEQRGDISENSRLNAEIIDLKEENNILQSEIRDLRNIIYQQLDTIMKTLQRLN